jgi:hypothetical protein
VTQLMNLTLLTPEDPEAVLFLEAVDGREPLSDQKLRTVMVAGGRRGLGGAAGCVVRASLGQHG